MNLVVGVLAIVLLTMIGLAVQALAEVLASRRGMRRSKAIAIPAQVALSAVYAFLAGFGRGWLGVLGVLGLLSQCFVMAAAFSRPARPWAPRNPTLAEILKMSDGGQAREALALLNGTVVSPGDQAALIAVRATCAYRAGGFEEAMGLHLQLAATGALAPAACIVGAADSRLSAALRDGRTLAHGELAQCTTEILSPDVPEAYTKTGAYAHSKALLTLASGDPETAMHAGVKIASDRSLVPADRAFVVAMIAVAAARAGHSDVARFWALKVPDWCPLRPAVERELGIPALDSPGDEDADCVFVD